MIERRKQSRVRVELRVEISGMDAACETFSQSAIATNLSRSGGLLRGVAAVLRCGDLLTVKYGERQAEFRIVWVLDRGAHDGFEVAVHRLAESPCPWEAVLGLEETGNCGEKEPGDPEEALVRK
ncbi:MAG TPA: hypothetical protein VH114_05475 [Candidatus Acidoferrum sp.]|jgi:hypothetical protein|nr:hypothetical protein [Candidatus Acidoferrum sp.]